LGKSTFTPFRLASAYANARCLGVICLLSGVSPSDDERFSPGEYEYLTVPFPPDPSSCLVGVVFRSPGRTSRSFPAPGGVDLGPRAAAATDVFTTCEGGTFGEVVRSGALTRLVPPAAGGNLLGLPSLFSFR
jgi:hypothetical protein